MYQLQQMPYLYSALEPYIETQIMELHHAKHQQAYVNGLNQALSKHPDLFSIPLIDLITQINIVPDDIRVSVRNHGGGVWNHTFFWDTMKAHENGGPVGSVKLQIKCIFDSFENFKLIFTQAARDCFGSGWVWLSVDAQSGKIIISTTANQDNPLSAGLHPILALDVWEHAYYLQYFNRRLDYVTAWWHVIDWERVNDRYEQIIKIL